MYKYSEIKVVHLEITSKCNVSCPMCPRNYRGGAVHPELPLTELSLEDIKKIFPIEFIKKLRVIYMCGNYGDPMIAKDTLKVFQFFRNVNPHLFLSLNTNGSGRSQSWWKGLAQVVNCVHFSVDGLEDTNSIYRRGAVFKKIMENAEAYISSGGKAVWDFIVFAHNEHQVEEARTLAHKMGFDQFVVKKTARFFNSQTSQVEKEKKVLNKKGEIEYTLKMPTDPQYQNPSLNKEEKFRKNSGSLYEHLNHTTIQCQVKEKKSIYVSAEGFIFPCCWTAALYPKKWVKASQMWNLIQQLPEKQKSLCGKTKSIEEIIQGDFFQKIIPKTWEGKDLNKDRLRACAEICGKEFTPFMDQRNNFRFKIL